MKVNGIQVQGPRIVSLHIPIGDEAVAEFKFRPLFSDDSDNFEKVMPKPEPKLLVKPGGQKLYDTEDKVYRKNLENWSTYKTHWEFLRSLSATDGLEWSKVKSDEPETWKLWEDEISEIFGKNTAVVFWNKFVEANILTEDTMERARLRFLASKVQMLSESLSQTLGQQNTESGGPVKDSD